MNHLTLPMPNRGLSFSAFHATVLFVFILFLSSGAARAVESGFELDASLVTHVAGGMPVSTDEANALLSQFDFSSLSEKAAFDTLNEAYKFSEIIEAKMPQTGNPRLWVFSAFRVEFKKAMDAIHSLVNVPASTVKIRELPAKLPVGSNPEIYANLSKITAAYRVANRLGIFLNFSILVERDSAEVGAALLILDRVMSAFSATVGQAYITRRSTHIATNLNMVKHLAVGIESSYRSLSYSDADQLPQRETEQASALRSIAFVLERINLLPSFDSIADEQAEIFKLSNAIDEILQTRQWSTAADRTRNLSLPDSGEVDGYDEAIDRVMKVQFGFELLKHQFVERRNWLQ